MTTSATRITLTREELNALREQIRSRLTEGEYATIRAMFDTLAHLVQLLEQRTTTLRRLRQLVFGARTEKTQDVLRRVGASPAPGARTRAASTHPGHGRHGAQAYAGAQTVTVSHASLHHADHCPACENGRVYALPPKMVVCIVGQAPLTATRWEIEKLRCHLCDQIFPAVPPPGTALAKYDPTAGSMIAVLKYGTGMPFYRLARLQASLGIPLPASTQWDIVAAVAVAIRPAFNELIRHAAQGEVLYNDDTPMRVLSLLRRERNETPETTATTKTTALDPITPDDEVSPERTGVFTSGIVAKRQDHRIALFFTGRHHAGENLAAVLARRTPGLEPPIQMCDALSRNVPKAFAVILANCLSHARRNVVDVTADFPVECRYVLETLRDVYAYDAQAREQHLSPQARLAFHQTHSGPLMEALHTWFTAQLDEHRIEPNSGLGEAITYFLKHWTTLTRFLTIAGAPLDNNVCERALKRAILHRKNSLFYKTSNGSQVGDVFMSLIHTCELNGADPFHYLTALQRHADAVASRAASWLPWNYRDTLQQLDAAQAA
jgi:hypothetical protein